MWLNNSPGPTNTQVRTMTVLFHRLPIPFDRGGSPDPFRRSRPMSPEPTRPMSPDGLGGGMGSSVFVDAGVEGLLQPSPINLRQMRCVAVAGSSERC
jgi:hypothetical protein